jgi:general secretion pathway protein D
LTSTQKNAPEGVVLVVIPTANSDTGEITLTVRPTISKVINNRPDPTLALQLAIAGVAAPPGLPTPTIPELTVQEIDSMLNMQSGQMMALGGLMKDENRVQQDGIPVVGDLPVVGRLFKTHKDIIAKSELVVLVRAVIVTGSGTIDEMDRKLYKSFSLDRHPGPM